MRKSLEQRREDPPRAFVLELELRIESLVRRRHQDLGRRKGARVHVAEERLEMQLGPRGADLARRCPIKATGFPVSGAAPGGREPQSIAVVSTPGMPSLYSGVAIITPSAARIAALNSTTAAGAPPPPASGL